MGRRPNGPSYRAVHVHMEVAAYIHMQYLCLLSERSMRDFYIVPIRSRDMLRRVTRAIWRTASPCWLPQMPAAVLACRAAASITIPVAASPGDVVSSRCSRPRSPRDLGALGSAHHYKESVAGVTIDLSEHASIIERGAESPMFVFLRREGATSAARSSRPSPMFAFTPPRSTGARRRSRSRGRACTCSTSCSTKAVALPAPRSCPNASPQKRAASPLLLLRYYGTTNYDKVSRSVRPGASRPERDERREQPRRNLSRPRCLPAFQVWMFNHEKHFDLDGTSHHARERPKALRRRSGNARAPRA